MTNPIFIPQPNYSGVTIQISNPAVNVVPSDGKNIPCINGGSCGVNQNALPNNQSNFVAYPQAAYNSYPQRVITQNAESPVQNTGYPNAYPAQYYINNYADDKKQPELVESDLTDTDNKQDLVNDEPQNTNNSNVTNPNQYRMYADDANFQKDNDMSKSEVIKENLSEREAEIAEEKKNTKETKIVALTDEYIKSLENYLNNPNDEIRLMASKEILTRLDEDKDRYDDAALNALLNKMMQDPNKLVRIAALSAFSAQLASGNDYTVKLLHDIQSNPNADKEDVLQAADILLKMSAGVEVKNIPNPSVKEKSQNKEQ